MALVVLAWIRETDEEKYEQAEGQMDGQTDGRTDEQMGDGWTDGRATLVGTKHRSLSQDT